MDQRLCLVCFGLVKLRKQTCNSCGWFWLHEFSLQHHRNDDFTIMRRYETYVRKRKTKRQKINCNASMTESIRNKKRSISSNVSAIIAWRGKWGRNPLTSIFENWKLRASSLFVLLLLLLLSSSSTGGTRSGEEIEKERRLSTTLHRRHPILTHILDVLLFQGWLWSNENTLCQKINKWTVNENKGLLAKVIESKTSQ